MTGYLVSKDFLKELVDKEKLLPEYKEQRDEYKELVEKYKNQRDDYQRYAKDLQELLELSKVVRDDYQNQRDRFEEELEVVEGKYEGALKEYAQAKADAEAAWSPWEVALLTAGVGILAVGSGMAIGFIYAR